MAISKAYKINGINVDQSGGAGSDFFMKQITDQTFDPGLQIAMLSAAGTASPTAVAIVEQAPRFAFTSSEIARIGAKTGMIGLKVQGDADEAGLEAYLQQTDEAGERKSGANHLKLTVPKAYLIPRTINAPHRPPAEIQVEAVGIYDGTNAIAAVADSQALAGTLGIDEVFCAGKVMINGAEVEGVQNTTVDFGCQWQILSGSGIAFPSYGYCDVREPSIIVDTTDASVISTYGLDGTIQSATDSIVYLRKVDLTTAAARVANATAQHISFTMDDGYIQVEPIQGSQGGGPIIARVRLTPKYDGTNAILVANWATAIT